MPILIGTQNLSQREHLLGKVRLLDEDIGPDLFQQFVPLKYMYAVFNKRK